jgi:hypothetical protein
VRQEGTVLLAFVCNPDRMLGRRLPQALNDALAASQVVPATIIGRTAHAANNAAVAEDRTCTLERLQHFLESKRPRTCSPGTQTCRLRGG